jgi:integrase
MGDENPYRGFKDLLTVLHATGARPKELCSAVVGNFQPRGRQLVLGEHKTKKTGKARRIVLDEDAFAVLERLCRDRPPDEPIFWRFNTSSAWTPMAAIQRFQRVRNLAGVREHLTLYSLRHLFISQMLQAGVDIFLVAKMAGNSVAVIEKYYGHMRSEDFQQAMTRLTAFRRGEQG